ncbi:MAG: Hsp70 family protein, partial [Deltaproteobacteria bacterium]|nr:Hsp70 family protein [Deltaproteobacteria bacterium]
AKLESLCEDLFLRSFEPVRKAVADAKLKPSDIDEVVLVGGSTRIPRVQDEVKKYFGREPHKGVNPDEVVALGAAVQAGVLGGEVRDVLLLDVTPLTLGIETLGSVMTKLIERNTTIPTKKSQVFSTAADSQTSVEIHVLQGEREMASGNRTLGKFVLDGIPSAPRGVPQIEVTFDIDANGIISVSAKDMATSKAQHITITASSGLSKEEVDRFVKEGKEHESEDKKRREEIETKNTAESLVYVTEKTVKENREKIPAKILNDVEKAVEACKEALKSEDVEKIKQKSQELTEASHKMAEELYKAGAEKAKEGEKEDSGKKKKEDDVVDAEYTEAKE